MTLTVAPPPPTENGIKGFSQKVLRYFLTFLQTDFKRQQAPRRQIQLKSDAGFRTAMNLRKYPSLYDAVWKFAAQSPTAGLTLDIPVGRYTASISRTLSDLIQQHVDRVPASEVRAVIDNTVQYAARSRVNGTENPEAFVDSVSAQFVDEVGTHVVQPLLGLLDSAFREAAYSAVTSVYDAEKDLLDSITGPALEHLPVAVNTLVIAGDSRPLEAVLSEFFVAEDLRGRIKAFFGDFATADAFQELRDLKHALGAVEQQALYLYLCEIRFGHRAYPLFYVPLTMSYEEDKRQYTLDFDPHLLVNKQAVDWILQEQRGEAARLPISPVADRIIYLTDGSQSFLDAMVVVFNRLIPAFEIAADIDLRKLSMQHASSPTVRISTAAYLAVFDRGDESVQNDYEELLHALNQDQQGAGRLFENIVRGFLLDNPHSVQAAVDASWQGLSIPERLVAAAPIALNEEQRKILSALRDPACHYISVQGPPGTGKSHTITAIAFDAILSGKSVLVLSDKVEALDVVQDKIEASLAKIRAGDEDFPNPILRLGKSGNSFPRIVSAGAREKVKTHLLASKVHMASVEAEIMQTSQTLRDAIAKEITELGEIRLKDLEELQRLEAELDGYEAGLSGLIQQPAVRPQVAALVAASAPFARGLPARLLVRLAEYPDSRTLSALVDRLTAWQAVGETAPRLAPAQVLQMFTVLEATHHQALLQFIGQYEAIRMPIFGFAFRGRRAQELNLRLGAELPCPDPIDLHKRLPDLKRVAATLGVIRGRLGEMRLEHLSGFAYRLLRKGEGVQPGVDELCTLLGRFAGAIRSVDPGANVVCPERSLSALQRIVSVVLIAIRYARLWHDVAARMEAVPTSDYVGEKKRVEQLHTARMAHEIDSRFIDFVENQRARVKEIGGIIKNKRKFPGEEFHHLSAAFPVIIAGIREYADYVPLREHLFDVVVIDEASQVSVAQALPALLRAKKVVVFGDAKQFSNVKSAHASNAINSGYLHDLEAYFRDKVSDAATKLERLKHFDVKRSILEFFDLIANYSGMLRKHFRGYSELISFSSKYFYEGQLQAIKIRSAPVSEVIRFQVLEGVHEESVKNTNRAEADFILGELREMVDAGDPMSVAIITPFREQVKLLHEVLFRDAYGERFESELNLKVFTFDTCQGEERELIIYSMVATEKRDVLNYVFPVTLDGLGEGAEDALKAQRLNVGLSRGQEAFLFVLSKPVEKFKGAIGRALMHYQAIVQGSGRGSEADVDRASPMERKVLDWIHQTPFFQRHEAQIEVIPQFPVGAYLKQLDPFYTHPAYRCDFLVRYQGARAPMNVIIEYDGFAEHFVQRASIHHGNWDRYYRPEDVERQMVIESYGYKFLRINRFNVGKDPVATLSTRLGELIDVAEVHVGQSTAVERMKGDAGALQEGTKKRCPKCGEIRELDVFWDDRLKNGHGGYGRNCLPCKRPVAAPGPSGLKQSSWRRKYRYRS
jgi:hypothetical protein